MLIFFERERALVAEGQRQRGSEDLKLAVSWQQRAQCGAWTHKSRDYDLSWSLTLNQLSHPHAPSFPFSYNILPNKLLIQVWGKYPIRLTPLCHVCHIWDDNLEFFLFNSPLNWGKSLSGRSCIFPLFESVSKKELSEPFWTGFIKVSSQTLIYSIWEK